MRKNENLVEQLSTWLLGLDVGVKPSVKINSGFTNATVVVDFGTPKEPVRLSADQSAELSNMMREIAVALTNRKSIRINHDNQNGVYWTSVA